MTLFGSSYEENGFDARWIEMIMRCVKTVSYKILINGEQSDEIMPSKGLRQGDPIPPYLFLLYTEALSAMITGAINKSQLYGVTVCTGAPLVSHLFFADDSFMFVKAELNECMMIRDLLLHYERVSWQKVNFDKSCVAFSKNVDAF